MSFDPYRHYTEARIGLGARAPALPTSEMLKLQYHHARAVDAIRQPWDLLEQSRTILDEVSLQSHELKTAVRDGEQYLLRPDLGRRLHDDSRRDCHALSVDGDVLLVASDGLSSTSVKNHLTNFLRVFLPLLAAKNLSLVGARIFLARHARVALVDDIGEIVKPPLSLMMIGERPGLSAPDSLAVYLTYQPRAGRSDAERNCISNIRPPHGLGYHEAAERGVFLVVESLRRRLSGVSLKDESRLLDGN